MNHRLVDLTFLSINRFNGIEAGILVVGWPIDGINSSPIIQVHNTRRCTAGQYDERGRDTFEPEPDFPTSSVFRAGLAVYTKLYAAQYAADNIRMNNILPGFIDSLPAKQSVLDRIPMNRYGTMTEISELIAFLASDNAAYITGQNIRIDGGFTRSI